MKHCQVEALQTSVLSCLKPHQTRLHLWNRCASQHDKHRLRIPSYPTTAPFSADDVLLQRFLAASALAGAEFKESVSYLATAWLPARCHVKSDLEARQAVHPSGEIVKLSTYCPWKEHLHELEEEEGAGGQVKYVLYEVSKVCKFISRGYIYIYIYIHRRDIDI